MKGEAKFQIGKSGVTDGFIETLVLAFKTRKQVRIHVLKSAGHDKDKIKEISSELVSKLPGNYKVRTIGFMIILRKTGKKL